MSLRLASSRNVSQISQVVANIEYFQITCNVLEDRLMELRATQRGGSIRLQSYASFSALHAKAVSHLTSVINAKLKDFFEMAGYDWTPPKPETTPSWYLEDMINWFMTVVDGLDVREEVKEEVYQGALTNMADNLMQFLVGPDVDMINEAALANLTIDMNFLETEFNRLGKSNVASNFDEIRKMVAIITKDDMSSYLNAARRQSLYGNVQPRKLASLLEKMGRYAPKARLLVEQQRAERRKMDALTVARLSRTGSL